MPRLLMSCLAYGVRRTLRPSLISIYTHASVPFGTKNINRRESPWAHLSASDHLQVPLMIKGTLTWSQNWRLGDEALWVRSFDGASRLVQRKSCIHKKYFFSLLLSFHIFCVFLVVPRTLVKSVSVENCSWLQHPQKEKNERQKGFKHRDWVGRIIHGRVAQSNKWDSLKIIFEWNKR